MIYTLGSAQNPSFFSSQYAVCSAPQRKPCLSAHYSCTANLHDREYSFRLGQVKKYSVCIGSIDLIEKVNRGMCFSTYKNPFTFNSNDFIPCSEELRQTKQEICNILILLLRIDIQLGWETLPVCWLFWMLWARRKWKAFDFQTIGNLYPCVHVPHAKLVMALCIISRWSKEYKMWQRIHTCL